MSTTEENDHVAIPYPVPLALVLVLVPSLVLHTRKHAHPHPQSLRYKSRPERWCTPRDAYNLSYVNAINCLQA